VPKKAKTQETRNEISPQLGGPATMGGKKKPSRRRSTSSKKSATAGSKKAGVKTTIPKESKPTTSLALSDHEIRMRAYFIAERRHRLSLPGDSNSDWLEAKRQLLSEVGPR